MIIKDTNQGFFFAVITTDGEDVSELHLVKILSKYNFKFVIENENCLVENVEEIFDLFLQKITIHKEEKANKYYLPINKYFIFQGKLMNANEIAKI